LITQPHATTADGTDGHFWSENNPFMVAKNMPQSSSQRTWCIREFLSCSTQSQPEDIIFWLKARSVTRSDEVAQSFIQSSLGNLQVQRAHRIIGKTLSMLDCLCGEKIIPE